MSTSSKANPQQSSVLFLGKAGDEHGSRALDYCRANFFEVVAHVGAWEDPLPPSLQHWHGDYIISYLSRWVVPESLLQKANVAAINFHPASPEYPGIGCNNFALYEEASEYGVTCHHMASKVDTGSIIAVKRFPIWQSDTVASVLSRTYDYQLVLFYEVLDEILTGEGLPASEETWSRKPFSRKQFDQLGKITPDMSEAEIKRRIRAIQFGQWKPTLTVKGFTFELKDSS